MHMVIMYMLNSRIQQIVISDPAPFLKSLICPCSPCPSAVKVIYGTGNRLWGGGGCYENGWGGGGGMVEQEVSTPL